MGHPQPSGEELVPAGLKLLLPSSILVPLTESHPRTCNNLPGFTVTFNPHFHQIFTFKRKKRLSCHIPLKWKTSICRAGVPRSCCCLRCHVTAALLQLRCFSAQNKHPTCSGTSSYGLGIPSCCFSIKYCKRKKTKCEQLNPRDLQVRKHLLLQMSQQNHCIWPGDAKMSLFKWHKQLLTEPAGAWAPTTASPALEQSSSPH